MMDAETVSQMLIGVAAIFGPGTPIPDAASTTINKAAEQLMRMHNFRTARTK